MNKFEKQMKDELNSSTPDLKENIKAKVVFNSKPKAYNFKHIAMPIMAVMVLLIAIITPIVVINPGDAIIPPTVNSYTVTISVNPSLEIIYDKDGYVLDVKPLNKDGLVLMQSCRIKNLKGSNIDTATNRIIDEIDLRGYFVNNKEVRLTVKTDQGAFDETQFEKVKANIDKRFNDTTINGTVISQMTEEELDRLEEDIEKNSEKYFEELKDEIKEYLDVKLPIMQGLVDDINSELVKMDATLTDITAIKNRFKKDKEPFTNEAIINIIKNFVENHPEYKDDIEDFEDIEELNGKDFYEIYEDIVEELEEVKNAINDINEGRVPDDIDDMIEDIYFPED